MGVQEHAVQHREEAEKKMNRELHRKHALERCKACVEDIAGNKYKRYDVEVRNNRVLCVACQEKGHFTTDTQSYQCNMKGGCDRKLGCKFFAEKTVGKLETKKE